MSRLSQDKKTGLWNLLSSSHHRCAVASLDHSIKTIPGYAFDRPNDHDRNMLTLTLPTFVILVSVIVLVKPTNGLSTNQNTKQNRYLQERQEQRQQVKQAKEIILNPKPWRENVPLDYSAANEYMAAHYQHLGYGVNNINNDDATDLTPTSSSSSSSSSQYFSHVSPLDGCGTESIYDARQGYCDDTTGMLVGPTLDGCGFTLSTLSIGQEKVTDWSNLRQISDHYLPPLEETIRSLLLDCDDDDDDDDEFVNCTTTTTTTATNKTRSKILHLYFYQPMLRGEKVDTGKLQSPVASLVHIDTDFGAHDVEDFVQMVYRNQIEMKDAAKDTHPSSTASFKTSSSSSSSTFPKQEIISALKNGNRFTIINAWKNADMNPNNIIRRAPLAIYSPRYDGNCNDDIQPQYQCQPTLRCDRKFSRWYVYPNMTHDEILLFKQYDRRVDYPSDIWHCSVPNIEEEDDEGNVLTPRISFDIRALVVFDEIVPNHLDRYGNERPRPILNLEESGCFCDSQAKSRTS